MTLRPVRHSLDALPLYAGEGELARALLGERHTEWRAIVPLLEGMGLPKIDGLMGGRHVGAVRRFFDKRAGLVDIGPMAPDGAEHPELLWRPRAKRRASGTS